MAVKFNDCYKNIITDLCDWSSSWTGYKALWLDECNMSNDSLIELVNLVLK